MDLELDSVLTVTFPNLPEGSVELRIRNAEQNEDEDGNGTIREGKTNYFIFPGDTGVDATFLTGASFATKASLTFTSGGVSYSVAPFTLRPHVH